MSSGKTGKERKVVCDRSEKGKKNVVGENEKMKRRSFGGKESN